MTTSRWTSRAGPFAHHGAASRNAAVMGGDCCKRRSSRNCLDEEGVKDSLALTGSSRNNCLEDEGARDSRALTGSSRGDLLGDSGKGDPRKLAATSSKRRIKLRTGL